MANAKFGWRWAYVGGGLALYYQDYGVYPLLMDKELDLKGATIVPNLFCEFRY